MTVPDAAAHAGCVEATIRRELRLGAAGAFPGARKVGRDWLIPAGEVTAYRPRQRGNPNWRKEPAP